MKKIIEFISDWQFFLCINWYIFLKYFLLGFFIISSKPLQDFCERGKIVICWAGKVTLFLYFIWWYNFFIFCVHGGIFLLQLPLFPSLDKNYHFFFKISAYCSVLCFSSKADVWLVHESVPCFCVIFWRFKVSTNIYYFPLFSHNYEV